eukprot:TRINITY_DN11724_c0_g1_i1.p2 TRINITY_DN11724_c0_g1~~TRINITY_DN11724_c0_g1_i1.p2  ORF type:complete len:282 (-),score=5.72 TRINITY_DN11724_c0_g1_i1:254-1099(-)
MLPFYLLALLVASVAIVSTEEAQPAALLGEPVAVCDCSGALNPVCCKGTTFSNFCEARCKGFEKFDCEPGQCVVPGACICPNIEDPTCCNGKEYRNKCLAECAGEKLQQCRRGRCKHDCNCPKCYDPVCCNGKEYKNKCLAKCAGDWPHGCKKGKCKACQCYEIYAPVCCRGHREYENDCFAICNGENIRACKEGRCKKVGPGPKCKQFVYCLVDPCSLSKCPGYECGTHYCAQKQKVFGKFVSFCTAVYRNIRTGKVSVGKCPVDDKCTGGKCQIELETY